MNRDSSRVAALARSAEVRHLLQRPPKLAPALRELRITKLWRRAADSSDRLASLGAIQLLEQVFVVTAFYEPREAMTAGNPARALALLGIAPAIHPGVAFVCSSRQEAFTKAGRADAAADLRCSPN